MRRIVSYSEFLEVVKSCVSTLSGRWRPLTGEQAVAYETTIGELVASSVYAPRFTTPDRTQLVNYDNPVAHPISVREFVARPDFTKPLLHGRTGEISDVQVVLLACTTCSNAVLIDGFHRTVHLARDGRIDVRASVFELAGDRWQGITPDMNVVCACVNQRRR